ncbi:MAG: hypothetical protein ABIM31_00025 [candidate division WOR-3 bacterium]
MDKWGISTITIAMTDNSHALKVQDILHRYANHIYGRLGLPSKCARYFIITVVFLGEEEKAKELVKTLQEEVPEVRVGISSL